MGESLNILILEDNPFDAEIVQFELREAGITFTAKVVMTEADFVHELQTNSPELILSDYNLPRYNGALALAEAKRQCPDVPFILVTGAIGEDKAIEILIQSAKDYVMKNRLNRLVPAVRRALTEAKEHQARREAEEKVLDMNKNLEIKVAERTSALQAEIAVRKQIEEEVRVKSETLRETNIALQVLLRQVEIVQSMGTELLLQSDKIDKNDSFVRGMMLWNILNPITYVIDYWFLHRTNTNNGREYQGDIQGVERYSNKATADVFSATLLALSVFQGYRYARTQTWAPEWLKGGGFDNIALAPLPSGGALLACKWDF